MGDIEPNQNKSLSYPNIKHLVISGGGTYGVLAYGALRETNNAGFWNREEIRSIHTVSAGGILAIMLLLGYDWETMDNYLFKRPWNKVFHYDIENIINAFEKSRIIRQENDYRHHETPIIWERHGFGHYNGRIL